MEHIDVYVPSSIRLASSMRLESNTWSSVSSSPISLYSSTFIESNQSVNICNERIN